ncbi:MAG: hypothetical protein QOJ64_233 [Acidobacteriota bacterium]|jgi:heme/copper-type cytochrome/quinol oxidase subunit 3|nr:hypothetical protein [Acidobacteriota bacterium]
MGVEVEETRTRIADQRRSESIGVGSVWAAVLRDLRLMLVALWLGSAVFFSATVAPSAFGVLRARNVPYANEAAGTIVTRTLGVVNTAGFVIALFLLASAFAFRRRAKPRLFALEIISTIVLAIATAVGQWIIAARMLGLRAAMGRPIDDVPADDALHASFNTLHGYSVAALGIAIIAAAVLLLVISRRGTNRG